MLLCRLFYGGMSSMTFTMAASAKATLDKLAISASLSGTVGGPGDMSRISISGSGSYMTQNVHKIEDFSSTFGMTLIPSAVKLALSNAARPGDAANVTTSFIDCNAWTTSIQEVYDSDRWMAPISYSFVPITSIFAISELFPIDLRQSLPTIRAALDKFINSCVYSDPAAAAIMADASKARECPVIGSARCVTGNQRGV